MILGSLGCGVRCPPVRGFCPSDIPASHIQGTLYRGHWTGAARTRDDAVTIDLSSGSWLALAGNPFWVTAAGSTNLRGRGNAAKLLHRLAVDGVRALADLDGAFAIVWWNVRSNSLCLIRDRFGTEPLHYWSDGRSIVFASRAQDVFSALGGRPKLSAQGLVEFLTYCYLPGNTTLFDGILRVPPGSILEISPGSPPVINSWYRLSFADRLAPDEADIARNYRELLEASVVARLDDGRAGIFLSGGMDSSAVATFARKHLEGSINTYSFRCAGGSFDESSFARALAAELGTKHREVEYGESEALRIVDAVAEMDSPFCDIGIEVGTWLLARAAQGSVDYVLTGDGGDELWASHPVYAAQRLMKWYDRLPLGRGARCALSGAFNLLRDSDQKRGLAVTLKRILPPAVNSELGHFRWRLYQTPDTLLALLSTQTYDAAAGTDPFRCVLESFAGYDGPDDGMSIWLYSDYRTASSFYFNRLLLARCAGLDVRMPFYDRALVEYGARIPAHLKLEGIERTKRLFRVAMRGVLPEVINSRKDKLGHSVPFKNWLRGEGPLKRIVTATLQDEQFRQRNLFRQEAVQRLLDEHRERRHNHSHRLWALFVLELWLRGKFT